MTRRTTPTHTLTRREETLAARIRAYEDAKVQRRKQFQEGHPEYYHEKFKEATRKPRKRNTSALDEVPQDRLEKFRRYVARYLGLGSGSRQL